jgi:hypothetical protein
MHHHVVRTSIQFYVFLNENCSNLPPPAHIHASQQTSNEVIDIKHLFIRSQAQLQFCAEGIKSTSGENYYSIS